MAAAASSSSPSGQKTEEEWQDCLPCRITGATAFGGLGVYAYFSGHSQLRQHQAEILRSGSMFGMRSRQAAITSLSFSLIGLGLYRLVN